MLRQCHDDSSNTRFARSKQRSKCVRFYKPWETGLRVSRVRLHKHRETGADVEKESVATTIFSSISKGKRDRDKNAVHSLTDRENLQTLLERKKVWAVRGEIIAQQKLYEAEIEVEAKKLGKVKF